MLLVVVKQICARFRRFLELLQEEEEEPTYQG